MIDPRPDLALPVGCTGYVRWEDGEIAHDDDTCPVHEPGPSHEGFIRRAERRIAAYTRHAIRELHR